MGNNSITLLSLSLFLSLGLSLVVTINATTKCEKAERTKLLKVCVTDRIPKQDSAISGTVKRTAQETRDRNLLKTCCDELKGFVNDDVAGNCLCTAYKLANNNVSPLLGEIDAVDLCNLDFTTSFECDDDN